jgi:hypothetical protein
VTTSPITDKFSCCPGRNISGKNLPVKIERGFLSLKFYVKVWRIMVSEYMRIMIPKNVEMMGMDLFYRTRVIRPSLAVVYLIAPTI